MPYADLSDPQTLNLYGYVRNNPLVKADPDGHCSLADCLKAIQHAADYVRSVAYLKIEGGIGIGASGRVGPIKAEVAFKRVSETKFAQPDSTKKSVIEIGAKVEAGPVKVGLSATGEQLTAKNDQIVEGAKREWGFVPGIDAGKGKQSGWDLGLGVSGYAGVGGGVEVGINGAKIVKDIGDAIGRPTLPALAPPPIPGQPNNPSN